MDDRPFASFRPTSSRRSAPIARSRTRAHRVCSKASRAADASRATRSSASTIAPPPSSRRCTISTIACAPSSPRTAREGAGGDLGGALLAFAYDAARSDARLPARAPSEPAMPAAVRCDSGNVADLRSLHRSLDDLVQRRRRGGARAPHRRLRRAIARRGPRFPNRCARAGR